MSSFTNSQMLWWWKVKINWTIIIWESIKFIVLAITKSRKTKEFSSKFLLLTLINHNYCLSWWKYKVFSKNNTNSSKKLGLFWMKLGNHWDFVLNKLKSKITWFFTISKSSKQYCKKLIFWFKVEANHKFLLKKFKALSKKSRSSKHWFVFPKFSTLKLERKNLLQILKATMIFTEWDR